MTANMPEEDRRSALLVRDAMERTVAELPPLHDLVPAAVTQGRRRRLRARLVIAAGSACVAGAAVVASLTLSGEDDARTTVRPATSDTPSLHESPSPDREPEPYRTPVHIEPTSHAERAMANLTPAERKRQAEFQQQAAVLLDRLLPDTVGLVRPVYDDARLYQGKTEGGKVFPLIFTVRPSQGGSGPRPCSEAITKKGGSCEHATLPGGSGIKATSLRLFVESPEIMSTQVAFSYAHSDVVLTVYPDVDAPASSPVTGEELLAAVGDSRFLDLVRDAAELPLARKHAGG